MTASPWAQPVFAVGESPYTWSDVAAFARRSGGWERLVREVREGLACQRAGHVADAAAVKQAAADFRYRRRLIMGEETEAWLRARHVEVDEWMDYVRRTVLRARHLAVVGVDEVGDDEVEPLLWPTGRCSGILDELAVALAERVAAHVQLTGDLPADEGDVDSAVDRFRQAVVTPEAVKAEVDRRRLDWLVVALESARFDTEGAARETVLAVRDDGLALAEVCGWAGVDPVRQATSLDRLDPALRAAVLGARPGELVGPVPIDGGFVVARVESKLVPSVDDPDISRRAAEVTLASALRREVEARVRWHDRP